jgi:hypothetical protein
MRGWLLTIAYVLLVVLAEWLVLRDVMVHDSVVVNGQRVQKTHNVRLAASSVLLGVVGLPLSAVSLGCAISQARHGGVPGVFVGGAMGVTGLILAPLVNLLVVGWLAFRRVRRRRAPPSAVGG